jgi:hypothetical protein
MENLLGIDNSLLDAKATQEALDFGKDIPQVPPQGFDVPVEKTPDNYINSSSGQRSNQITSRSNRPNADPLFAAMAKATQSHYNKQASDLIKVSSYNPEIKERYKADASLYHDYFDPKSDNERVAAENWDKWDAISAGLGRFKDSFNNSFSEAAYTWVRAGKSLFNADVDYLSPTQSDLEKMAYEQHRSEIENPIFYKPGTEGDFLTKGFLAETMGNIGFTFGTIGEVFAEQIATKAAEAGLALLAPATGGASAGVAGEVEAATDISSGLKIGKMWKTLVETFTGKVLNTTEHIAEASKASGLTMGTKLAGETTQVLRTVNQADDVVANGIKYGKGFWDHALKMATYVPFVGEIAQAGRIAKAGKNILTTGELYRVGLGGLRRSFSEWQMAAGEAAIEAGGVYTDLYDQFRDEYRQKNPGQEATGEELLKIKKLAMESATSDFGTNIAILGITNKIQWGNVIGNFGYESKAINAIRNSLAKEASELGVSVVEGIGKKTGKELTQAYQKGLMGTLGLLPKIASDFSTKQAAWELGKSMLKGLTKIEISEGLQENFQDIASGSLKDYYTDIYRGDPENWGKSFNEALNSQITKQGLKTFLSGALTGLFIGPAMNVIEHAQTSKFLNPDAAAHRESVAKSIVEINNYFNGDSERILKEAVKQIKLQTFYNDGMIEGILHKDKYQYHNNKDSALIQTIMHAKRTGTLGNLISSIKGYGETFDNDQFKSAFGFSPEEIGKGSAQDVMNDIAGSVEKYSELYDKYQDKYGLLLSIDDLIGDPARKQKFSIRKAALLDAIDTVAFIESKSKASIKRAAQIKDNIGKYDSIGNSLHTAWSTITSPEAIADGIRSLSNEIKTIQEGVPQGQEMDEKTKQLLDSKKIELVLLSEVKGNIFNDVKVEDPDNPGQFINVTEAKVLNAGSGTLDYVAKVVGAYLTHKNKQAGLSTAVSQDDVQNATLDIYHYMALGQDHSEYVDAVNLLNDPDNFGKYHQNLADARAAAHARLLYDTYMKLGSISEVAKKWLDENKQLTDELLQFSKTPHGTFENMIKLQEISNKLADKFNDFETQKVESDKIAEETRVKQEKEEAEKKAKIAQSRIPIPVITLLSEAENDPTKRDQIMSQINEYMSMRYDLAAIESGFPYNSTEPSERTVDRFFLDADGNKQLIKAVKIPATSSVQEVDQDTGEITVVEVPLNTYENLYNYLQNLEQAYYDAYTKRQEKSTEQTATKTEAIDNAKSDLANFVGQKVVLSGNKGTLEIENDKYVVKLDDGTVVQLADVSNTKASFNDFTNLSVALESLPEEHKAVMGSESNAVVDVQDSGTVRMSMDKNLKTVTIEGVTWDIEFGPDGLATGFTRTYKKKKGKGEKLVIERMSGKNPKNQEYVARVNNMIMNVTRPMPTNETELVNESEVYDVAIQQANLAIESEADARKRLDEQVAQYQVNKIKSQEITDDILEIKTKFDNPTTREQLTSDERLKLFMWASDLVKKIKKEFRVWTTNEVINSAITELEKEYINPISEIEDAGIKPGSKTVTERSPSKKERAQKSTKGPITREGKRGAAKSKAEPRAKKVSKGGVAKAVGQLEMKFDNQLKLDLEKLSAGTTTANPAQDLVTEEDIDKLFEVTPTKIQSIEAVIPQATVAPVVTDTRADIGKIGQGDLNKVQKFTINRANTDLKQAPTINYSEIDAEKSGLDISNEEVERVRVLEYRGENANGVRIGTVRIDGTTSEGVKFSETFDVYFKEDATVTQPKETPVVEAPVIQVTDPLEDIGEEMKSLYEKIELLESMNELAKNEDIPELKVLRYIPKILPESAKAETGAKTGTKSDIHVSMLSKTGVTVQQAAHDIWQSEFSSVDSRLDESDIRDIIIDILTSGSKKAYESQFKESSELKRLKKELKELEDKYNKLANPEEVLVENPFTSLINKLSCEL